ncbi:MAG: phosphate/phosphite/phosphonate ABC transporter substrate-binding protein, partial [Myxococcales bacterium]
MRPHHLLPLLWLLAGTSCSTTPVAARTSATPLTFGAVPAGERGTREAELAPLVEHLARVLNRPVQLEVPASYRAMAQGMAEARWELAYVGPILYSRAHETSYDAVAVPVRDGKTTVEGVLLARRDRGLSELAALKGKRIAFVDPSSSAGFQYPFALLYANGLPPGSYERRFVGSHAAVLRAVRSGE